ncbi:type I restriction endonuclease [Rheinheimera sp.]|uniref:type I restriction endonuclease n=1 Tax=Rheinheimera sp. TaxID=1869214 RepID=UPI002FDEDD20
MDFIDQLRLLSSRIANTINLIQTEEATKNAMVMPFINILGYNPFDPLEVTPELTADVGTKKGEKVDYAILKDGKPILIFECKKAGGDLNIKHAGQLFRYFHVTETRFGVLTNGLVYRFFTDLEQPNKMDEKPFFEFNILDFKEKDVEELKKFAKSAFDVDNILNTANDLKYVRAVHQKINEFMTEPSDEFVKLVAADLIGTKRFTPALKEQFSTITKRAFDQLIGDKINERLKGAMTQSGSAPVQIVASKSEPISIDESASEKTEPQVITTPEELEGFYAVRAMLRDVVQPKRITMRDAQSYCAILLDNNNRKPLCRLRFNNVDKLKVGIFNTEKEEEIFSLENVDDLFSYADSLKNTLKSYD